MDGEALAFSDGPTSCLEVRMNLVGYCLMNQCLLRIYDALGNPHPHQGFSCCMMSSIILGDRVHFFQSFHRKDSIIHVVYASCLIYKSI